MRKIVGAFLFLFAGILVSAQSEEARKNNFNLKKNVVLDGYDPVSYFDNKPLEGEEAFRATYKGVTYFFANQSNLNRF